MGVNCVIPEHDCLGTHERPLPVDDDVGVVGRVHPVRLVHLPPGLAQGHVPGPREHHMNVPDPSLLPGQPVETGGERVEDGFQVVQVLRAVLGRDRVGDGNRQPEGERI